MAIVMQLLTVLLLLMSGAAGCLAANDPAYPSKQIRIILGFAAGGAPYSGRDSVK